VLARNETIFKWFLYSAAAVLCLTVQSALLQRLTLWGVIPFVCPLLAAIPATWESPAAGTIFSMMVGVACDLLLPAPIPCFYTLVFPLVGLFASLLSHSLLRPGLLCSLVSAAMAFALTDGFACFVLWSRGKAAWGAGAFLALREFCVTAPWIIPVTLLFQAVFHRTHPDE